MQYQKQAKSQMPPTGTIGDETYFFCRYNDRDGKIILKKDRIEWLLAKGAGSKLVVPYSEMGDFKSSKLQMKVVHQIRPPKELLFTFETTELLTGCVHLMKETRKKIRQTSMETFEVKIPTLDENKSIIFEKNPELKLIHVDLVAQGIISDEDFWNVYHRYLDHQRLRYQAIGTRNASLKVLTDQKTQGCNYVKIFMPTSLKQNIFIQYPGVKTLFNGKVPKTIPEAQFWRMFLDSYTKSNFLSKGAEILDVDIFADQEREEEKIFLAEPMKLDREWDMTRDCEPFPNYGLRKDEMTGADRYDVYGQSIKFINRTSSNIVKTIELQERDMEDVLVAGLIGLSIPDKSKYIEGHLKSDAIEEDVETSSFHNSFINEIQDWSPSLELKLNGTVSTKITNELNQSRLSIGIEHVEVPEDFKENFAQTFMLLNAALHIHYKGIQNSNLQDMLRAYYERVNWFKESYRTLTSIIQPSLSCIDKVIDAYNNSGEGVNEMTLHAPIILNLGKRKAVDDFTPLKKVKQEIH